METESSKRRRRMMEGEIEEERFLFLGSKYNLFCIDLKKTEEKYGGECREFSYNPPPAEVVWSTHIHATWPTSDQLPFGMSSTRFSFKTANLASSSSSSSRVLVPCSTTSCSDNDNDILLIGGELQDPSSPWRSTHTSREIYKLIPEISSLNGDIKDIHIELADPNVPRMKGGKASPIVEEIGGNLYVLHSSFIHAGFFAQADIPFEVFEPKLGEWRILPVPPFFAANSGTVIYAHAVFGHSLVVETSKEYFYFDTIMEEWYCSDHMTSHLINRFPMIVPSGLPCFGFDQHGRQLFVGISMMVEPCGYLVAFDGTLLACQSLCPDIYKDILPSPYPPTLNNVLIPLKSSEQNVIRMCACSIISHNDGFALLVSFFSAKIFAPSQQLIYKLISGELPHRSDHPAYSSFLEIFVERKFILTASYRTIFSMVLPCYFELGV